MNPDNNDTQNEQTSSPISSSPYYKENESTLPTGVQVEAGGLYMKNDEGGLVFQLSNNSQIIEGALTSNTSEVLGSVKELKINKGENSASIYSYKGDKPVESQFINWKEDIIITNLIFAGLAPLPAEVNKSMRLKVKITHDNSSEQGYLYTVHDPNGQLVVIHMPKPSLIRNDKGQNEKEVTPSMYGLVYLDYKDNTYIGYMKPTCMSIDNTNNAFSE